MDIYAPLRPLAAVDPAYDASRESYAKLLQGKSASELRWWSKDTVALVTGANKGLGLEIARQLAAEGITTILTARDEGRGLAAVDVLKAEGLDNVFFQQLDVTIPDSATKLAIWVKEKFGGLDILVGNAGLVKHELSYEDAKATIETNYYGQKLVVSAMLPLLRPSAAGARIVFISSDLGQIKLLNSEKLKEQFSDIDNLTEEGVEVLAAKYLADVKAGRSFTEWTTFVAPQYNESKLLLNAYSRVLAKSLSSRPEGHKIYVNSMTPGFCATDINGNPPGARTVKEGVDTALWLLLFPSGGPTGGFFKDRADYPF